MLNIEHTLFQFQERDMNNVIQALTNNRKILFQAQTSYGKTYSFCTVGKWFNTNYNKKILILAHSEELVRQAMATCIKMGLTVEVIESKTKRLHNMANVYIAMEKTLYNRIEKNKRFLLDVGMVIVDECHLGNFEKHINFFQEQKILGFTATPVVNERITYWKCDRCQSTSLVLDSCCNMEMMEWSKPKTMSMYYDDIVVGASVDELIEFGQIVRDYNITVTHDLSSLKVDGKGDFSNESQNKVFGGDDVLFDVVLHYEQYAKGKKTIIFNPSAKVNKLVYDKFKEKGYNIKLYDSVNDTDDNRRNTVKWFDENDDAILCNVSCFTTGFDSKEVQCIIINRSTMSLSLFLQIVGRGARRSDKIYKDFFTVIDLGGNVNRFNRWSDPTRDWVKIFFEGIGKDRAKKETAENVRKCEECGGLTPRHDSTCEVCGFKPDEKIKPERLVSEDVLQPIDKLPLPNGQKIADYVEHRKENIHFGFKILASQILDLFAYNSVTKGNYLCNLEDGRLDKRLGELIRPVYFVLIKRFPDSGNRTLKQVTKKIKEKLGKYYNI